MYHKPYRVVVHDPMDDYKIRHQRSCFSNKQRAIDRCWKWVDARYCALIVNPKGVVLFYADADTRPHGVTNSRKE